MNRILILCAGLILMQPDISLAGDRTVLQSDGEGLRLGQLRAIQCDVSRLPLKTAAEELHKFITTRQTDAQLEIGNPVENPPLAGTLILGTPDDNPLLARWAQEGKLGIAKCSASVDSYEIALIEGCVAVIGANPRAVVYGVFELEDILAEHGGVPEDFHSRGAPKLNLRLLHPRARGGFHGYRKEDIEFIARSGGNVAHLNHDWMAEKNLFAFVPCEEFPQAITSKALANNRKHLRQYIDWCNQYGLRVALWLSEIPCQGGPWIPEKGRQTFLKRFPKEVLSDTGTYQGKGLCLAHPLVEKAYRGMIRQLLIDFPELEMAVVFTLDSNGELCDPKTCPRHKGVSKYRQYNRILRLLLEEGRKVRSDFQTFSLGWSWSFRNDPEYLTQFKALPDGAGLTVPADAEAWSFDRKITNRLLEYRQTTRELGRSFLGYDIFLWGDDCQFPASELYNFPLGIAAKIRRWESVGVDGFFDQWGTQAEYVSDNALALRAMLFHPELAELDAAQSYLRGLAEKKYGKAAGPHVMAAWQEIEAAQQIQSDHTYYWHHLRPNWAGPTLKSPLTLKALRETKLKGLEPTKPYGKIDYCPHSDDEIAATRVLGAAIQKAAGHFDLATLHLKKALKVIDSNRRSSFEHWYQENDIDSRQRLTPQGSLRKQLVSVELHAKNQGRMGRFFAAYSLVKNMPEEGKPGYQEAMASLKKMGVDLTADDTKTAPGLVLEISRKKTPQPNYGLAVPEKITGRVTSDGIGVPSVSVSDGYGVVKTGEDGSFSLKPDPRSVFVFLTKPSGYSVVGDWYQALSSNINFQLEAADESDYYFIHVTDTHVSNNKLSQEGLSQFVREVNSLSPGIRFVLNSGDLVNLSKSLDNDPATGRSWMGAYSGIMNHLEMPYYNVAGDHSDSSYRLDEFPRGDTRCGKPLFWEYLGPNLFSFEYGKIHFVSVDYANHLGKRQLSGKEYPTLQLQADQVKWMARDMSMRHKGSFVITTSEWDLVEHCEDFERIAKANDIRLQLVGDSHTVSYKEDRVPYRIGGALSGCWWNKKTDLCPDLNQRGYFIYHVRGEKIDQFYKGLGRRVEIISHRTGDFWTGKTVLQAHLVQPNSNELLEYSLDGSTWIGMKKSGEPFYRRTFEAEIDSSILKDGFVTLQVRSSITKETSSVKVVCVNRNQSKDSQTDGVLKFSVGKWRNARKSPSAKVEVFLNGKIIGELKANTVQDYTFPVAASFLQKANILSFRFSGKDDEMGISQLTLSCGDNIYRDPMDTAIREVKSQHWGAASADWGAFIVGAGPLAENSFTFKRNTFLFVLE